jgi:phospholipid N-methyltransferase
MQTPVRDALRFFGTFLRHPTTVGAVLPSSRSLARALVGDLAATAGGLVVEYGPGTGAMTRVIAERLPPGIGYLGIELDGRFCARLRQRYPTLRFHHGSVVDVERIVADAGLGRPGCIVSGLPFASLPIVVQRSVIDGTRAVLVDGGEFRTFQYVHAYPLRRAYRFREAMAERFERFHRSTPILCNVPPAYVLTYS